MGTTRVELHRIGAQVLGRRRFEVSGHFGLRASPGGLATPAFGPETETVRLAGPFVVREVGQGSTSMALQGTTLRQLVRFAGAELEAEFSAGPDSPPLGDVDAPIELDEPELAGLVEWFGRGWSVLDQVTSSDPAWATRSTIQLLAGALRRGDGGADRSWCRSEPRLLRRRRLLRRALRLRWPMGRRTTGLARVLERSLRGLRSHGPPPTTAAACRVLRQPWARALARG